MLLSEHELFDSLPLNVVESLKGKVKREWFVSHAYLCPPLVLGNEHGFIVKSLYDFRVRWNGGVWLDAVEVDVKDRQAYESQKLQVISSHFGMGTFTVQNRFSIRTEPGVNIMTINPPNFWIDGIHHMTGVVETDNLRRDFTFNLKITRANEWIEIHKGDPIGCILPYPRHFIDDFVVKNAKDVISKEDIAIERQTIADFATERSTVDINKPNRAGRRYFNGEDVYGNKFAEHQCRLKRNPGSDTQNSEDTDIHNK